MDWQETKPAVLARIPDLGVAERRRSRKTPPSSSGRVIGQALSFKLLAAAVLLLVAIAVVPFVFRKKEQSTSPSIAANALPEWQHRPSAPPAGPAPAKTVFVSGLSAPAAPSPLPAPGMFPQPKVASDPPAVPSGNAEMMSVWPHPNHPISVPEAGAGAPRASANQAMAIRPPEYSTRNNYDRTRSGVH